MTTRLVLLFPFIKTFNVIKLDYMKGIASRLYLIVSLDVNNATYEVLLES